MENIIIKNSGYIFCHSEYYSVIDIINDQNQYNISIGTNKFYGEIDSGVFAISYLISMYDIIDKRTLFQPLEAVVDGIVVPLSELSMKAAYLDVSNPLFLLDETIREMVSKGLKSCQSSLSPEDVRELFHIDIQHFERPLRCVGNTKLKAMAAIAYSNNKDIFCFPWLSYIRYEYLKRYIEDVLGVLESMNKIAILPVTQAIMPSVK